METNPEQPAAPDQQLPVPAPDSPVLETPPAKPSPAGVAGVVFAIGMALLGGLLGILGALAQEIRGAGALGPFLGGPVIEEALKPVGLYILLIWWPQLVSKRLPTACLAALSGLSFGLIESTIYLFVYVPHHTHAFFVFRYTVDVAVHTLCSFIVGLGINRSLIDSAMGRIPFLQGSRRYYVTAILIHAGFNVTVTVLDVTGVLRLR